MAELFNQLKDEVLTLGNLLYLLAVLTTPFLVRVGFAMKDRRRQRKRIRQGLPETELVGPSLLLYRQKLRAICETISVLVVILAFPFIAAAAMSLHQSGISGFSGHYGEKFDGWKIVTGLMLAGFSFAAADVLKSYVSGLFFFCAITMGKGLQVGDRVTLSGYSGKVTSITPLFVQLVTADDDFVSLPTKSLWSEPVVSANAGERASLCVMQFRLAPSTTREQQVIAEDAIWEAIQASAYVDLSHRVQIYYEQELEAILITAKAYVASTYMEREFKSDVTKAFLTRCDEKGVPLSGRQKREDTPLIRPRRRAA